MNRISLAAQKSIFLIWTARFLTLGPLANDNDNDDDDIFKYVILT